MELDRLTAGALAGARWAATFRPALYPLVRAGKYGPPNPDRLTTAARTLAEWLALTWRAVDTETLPEITSDDYPERLAALHFEVGVATLKEQHSQAAVLDSKLAVAGGVSLTIAALIPSTQSAFGLDLPGQTVEGWLIIIGAATLLFAFMNSMRGLWPRIYRSLPSLADIRELATGVATDEDARWAITVAVEQAVAANERVMKARLAPLKLAYCSLFVGIVSIILAFAPHLAS